MDVLLEPAYSQRGRAVVDQAVQQPQQIVLPIQVPKALLHHLGKHVVLQILQRKDVFSFEKKKKKKMGSKLVCHTYKPILE